MVRSRNESCGSKLEKDKGYGEKGRREGKEGRLRTVPISQLSPLSKPKNQPHMKTRDEKVRGKARPSRLQFSTPPIFLLFVCFVLFCFVLFCFVLFCFVLFCFVLFCFVLFFFRLLNGKRWERGTARSLG